MFAIAAWLVSAATGSAFLEPESGRVNTLIAEHGADSPEVMARVQRLFLVARIDLVILIVVILDMTLKPG